MIILLTDQLMPAFHEHNAGIVLYCILCLPIVLFPNNTGSIVVYY